VIARILELAAPRAAAADVRTTDDQTLVLTLTDDAATSAASLSAQGASVRVVNDGRVGRAGTTDQDVESLVDRALASAAASDPLPMLLPGPSPLPPVATHDAEAAALDLETLADLGWRLSGRLRRDGRRVMVHLERSVGRVRIANTRGLDAGYDAVLTYNNVTLDEVTGLVQDAIFSRPPKVGVRTGMFFGGKNASLALDMLAKAKKALVPPFGISFFADPAGSFTTAAAMLACIEKLLKEKKNPGLQGRKVAVFGATGCSQLVAYS